MDREAKTPTIHDFMTTLFNQGLKTLNSLLKPRLSRDVFEFHSRANNRLNHLKKMKKILGGLGAMIFCLFSLGSPNSIFLLIQFFVSYLVLKYIYIHLYKYIDKILYSRFKKRCFMEFCEHSVFNQLHSLSSTSFQFKFVVILNDSNVNL